MCGNVSSYRERNAAMFSKFLSAVVVSAALCLPATAATVTQLFEANGLVPDAILDTDSQGATRERVELRHLFDGFNSDMGKITGATLTIRETFALQTMVAGTGAGRHRGIGRVNSTLRIGNRRNTVEGPVRERLSSVRNRARCTGNDATPVCIDFARTMVEERHVFSFDADRARDLFMDPREMRLIFDARSRIKGSGTAITWVLGSAYSARLDVSYAIVPLPASGVILISALGGLALVRRRKRAA